MATGGIATHHLTKYYGSSRKAALRDLSISIPPGEIYGFLGANGAGKSTTIRLLLNFLQPSSGSAQIGGHDTVRDSVYIKQQVGYLAGDVALYQKPTGRELLDYLGSFYQRTAVRGMLEKRFEADLDKPIGSLSKGNRQKLGIIQAFMHEPSVLILDEPTSGLDPLMQEAFYETLREAKNRGAAVLMSSHNLAEAQRVCDRVGIIKHGTLVREQAIGQSVNLGGTVFTVTFGSQAALQAAKKAPGLEFVAQLGPAQAQFRPKGAALGKALAALGKLDIAAISTETLDLEDEFLEFYGAEA